MYLVMDSQKLKNIQDVVAGAVAPVEVVAVTKTFPFNIVEEAYFAGFRHIGENRVEEADKKIKESRARGLNDIVWHMVGHVQSRKAGDVAGLFDWVDSVDSSKIVRELDREASKLDKKLHILLEVNLTGEETKYGFDLAGWESNPQKLQHFYVSIHESMRMNHIVVEGLMTMPPYVTNAEDNRPIFQSMKRLSNSIRAQIPEFGTQLSMGTSCDWRAAVEEGATMIRLGEALFGKRKG
jgi:PLP dependent protein